MSVILEQFRAEGEVIGEARLLLRYLSRLGTVSEDVVERIQAITDVDELDRFADIAWDCKSLDEFEKHLP